MSGPFADTVQFYRNQLQNSDDRFRTMVELLSVVDFAGLSDEEKLKHAWYIQLVAGHILSGQDMDNAYYG